MILFYVTSIDVNAASVRYRALLPAMHLNKLGVEAKVCSGEIAKSTLRAAKCIVFSKAFTATAVKFCAYAKQLDIPIVLDLCDDIFEDRLGGLQSKDLDRHFFRCMASLATSVTTTTEILAGAIRSQIPSTCDIHIIPDMVERLEDVQYLRSTKSSVMLEAGTKNWRRDFHRRKKWLAARIEAITRAIISRQPMIDLTKSVHSVAEVTKTIVWFGNHGSRGGESGMAQLLTVAPDLTRLSQEFRLRLVIISNSRRKFDEIIAPLPFVTQYLEWEPTIVFKQMKMADVCVIPFASDKFGKAKSTNRILLALSQGVPVICSDLPSLGGLKNCVLIEDWYNSLKTYLTRLDIVTAHLERAREAIRKDYTGEVIAVQWREVAFPPKFASSKVLLSWS